VVQAVHAEIGSMIQMHKESKVDEPLMLGKEEVKAVLQQSGVSEAALSKFSVDYDEAFGFETQLHPKNVIDQKKFEIKTPDVTIKVNPERSDLIRTEMIHGTRYILIRADEGVEVNGLNIRID
jgi:predicted HAD superfamily hydrolase